MAYRIAIVEDEHIVGLDIRMHLENSGYVVTGIYASGEDALAGMEADPPDLAVMDIRIQGNLDGVETARLAKEKLNIPVIVLTAMADESTLQRAKLTQPFAYIIKPFEERELRTAIEIALYRHRMEQALYERQQLFSTTLASIQDAVIVTDMDFHVTFLNPIAEQMLGTDLADLGNDDLRERYTLETMTGEPASLIQLPPNPIHVVRRDETRLPVDVYVSPLKVSESEQTGWVIVLHDVAERLNSERMLREQEEQLRQSQKMEAMGRLTGGIAHDFNNLLTVIMGYAKLLGEEIETIDQIETSALLADVDGIHKAATRSATLTRQLLAFSRHQVMERRVVSLNQVVADMEKLIERLVSDDVSITVDLGAGRPVIHADPGQIEQVIMNLIVNARDAMPGGGRIALTTENRELGPGDVKQRDRVSPGEFVVLTVRDTGTGMSADVVEKIFEPFFTTKEHGRGTGLGLSTVYGIVAQSGGFVEVDSSPGKGSALSVFLPVHKGSEERGRKATEIDDPSRGSETILLVEDDDGIRALLSRVLSKRGYEVIDAANPADAIQEWDHIGVSVDLLVTDIVMPGMPGTHLAERFRSSAPDLKVLLMSAFPESYLDDGERERLGMHFIEKPLDPREFVLRVRQILDE